MILMCRSVKGGLVAVALFLSNIANATQYVFRVNFTEKNKTPYSVNAPAAFLSQRALDRRALCHIPVDYSDLPVDPAYISTVLSMTGGKLHGISKWQNYCVILLSDSSQIHAIDGQPFITSIALTGILPGTLHAPVTRTSGAVAAARTTSGATYYGSAWQQTDLVKGNALHDLGFKGQGKLIAVLDAGFIGARNSAFDSMWTNGRVVDTFNFNGANSNVFVQDGHGTEVLSEMAAYVPGTFVGSAPLASYALYLTENEPGDQPFEMDNIQFAVERADSIGADVITISLGYDLFDPPYTGLDFATDLDGKSTVAAKAANMATAKGMLFVATAGNDGQGYFTWGNHILTPGDADSALTIGATYPGGAPAALSGYGPNAAGQVKPDVSAMGSPAYYINSTGSIASGNGTSYSTPQVAGWAACLWQAHPLATPFELRQAIIKCASTYAAPQNQLGYGVPDFNCTQTYLSVGDPKVTASEWLTATPNPFRDDIMVTVTQNTDAVVSFRLTDMSGRIIVSAEQQFRSGSNIPFIIPCGNLPTGIYMLRAVSATREKVLKLEHLR